MARACPAAPRRAAPRPAAPRVGARWAALLALAACGGPIDADRDGAPAGEDCDDGDPWVYPGAPDAPGDGFDADCDGEDAPFAFLGAWSLGWVSAGYSGVEVLQPETAEGSVVIDEALGATLDIGVTLNPAVTGDPLPVRLQMRGAASALPGPADFHLSAEGENYGELMHIDWDCAADEGALRCAGELKAFDSSLDAEALFSAEG